MHKGKASDAVGGGLITRPGADFVFEAPRMHYAFQCVMPNGEVRWNDGFYNLVTTAGKTDLVDKYFKNGTVPAAWYVGLMDNAGYTGEAAGDTAASHTGWVETHTTYSQANRPTLTFGTASNGAVSNSASPAAFSMTGTITVKGAFVISNNTKGGTTGTLYSVGVFGASRSVVNGDTLNVTVTLTIA